MNRKLRLPTPGGQRRETSYLTEDRDGFLMSVPESRLKSAGGKLSDSLIERTVAELERRLRNG